MISKFSSNVFYICFLFNLLIFGNSNFGLYNVHVVHTEELQNFQVYRIVYSGKMLWSVYPVIASFVEVVFEEQVHDQS